MLRLLSLTLLLLVCSMPAKAEDIPAAPSDPVQLAQAQPVPAQPSATLGIRGTSGLVEVPEDGGTAGQNNIKLYPDADGHVGRIEVNDRSGARLGFLTQGASGFSVRPGSGGGRVSVVPLMIPPQM